MMAAGRPKMRRVRRAFSFPLLVRGTTAVVTAILLAPLVVIVGASFTAGQFMDFPPKGLSLHWYAALLQASDWMGAIQVSLSVAALSAMLATSIGFTLALAVTRFRTRGHRLLVALGVLPLLFPPVVIGVAFLSYFYQVGLSHTALLKLVLAHAIFNCPFPFLLAYSALAHSNKEWEEAAMSLGARPARVLRTITVPLLYGEIFAGLVFAFVLSLNDFIVAFIVSSFTVTTLPIQIYSSLRYSYSPLIAVASTCFIAITSLGIYLVGRSTRERLL